MNLLGKIFTVLILLASVSLMVIAMFVYATHRNWKEAYDKVNAQLAQEQTAKADLEAKYQQQISQLKSEQTAALQDVAKLETERNVIVSQNQTIQKEVDQLRQDQAQSVALVKSTEVNNERLMDEVTGLRNDVRVAQQDRDEQFHTTLKATSELHSVGGQLQQLQERSAQVVAQLADVTAKAKEAGVNTEGEYIPRVRGKVSKIQPNASGQLIEITIGADDGVRPGQTVEVFRGDRYLGRAEILKADPDRAVGQVIRKFQQGQIQENDDVATKLRVG
jgi:predicted  nucleic acid-binding Zn-ribbon protein